MQNFDFEEDKREFMQKIYKIDKGSNFFKANRTSGGIGGINPILRFLSDEKSVLYKHLQSKETPLQMSKEAFLCMLMEKGEKGKKYQQLTPKRE